MAQYNDKAEWLEIDPASLGTHQRQCYDAYKDLYREMKAARQAFEASMQEGVPQGKRMVFGYRFGKLSVAIVEAIDAPKPKQSNGKLSLQAFLASAQQAGVRA